jgi:hypothetical protein
MKTLWKPLACLAAAVLLATAAAPPADAQLRQCGPRDSIVSALTARFGETRRGMGTAGPTAIVELYASAETGTWTVTVTMPDGMTCLIASGHGWETLVEELPAKGDPA